MAQVVPPWHWALVIQDWLWLSASANAKTGCQTSLERTSISARTLQLGLSVCAPGARLDKAPGQLVDRPARLRLRPAHNSPWPMRSWCFKAQSSSATYDCNGLANVWADTASLAGIRLANSSLPVQSARSVLLPALKSPRQTLPSFGCPPSDRILRRSDGRHPYRR